MSALATRSAVARHAFAGLVRSELRLNVREPAGLVVGFGLPVVLLLVFGSIPKFLEPTPELGGLTPLDLYGPILMVFTLSMLALNALPMRLATYRELGFLRRLAVTPVPPTRLLAAQLTVYVGVAVAAIAVMLLLGYLRFGMRLPGSIPGLVVTVVLTGAALFPIGLWVSAVAATAKAAGAIGSVLFFVLAFCAGLWWPVPTMPEALRAVVERTPTGAAVQALNDTVAGGFPSLAPLLVLVAYAVVFTSLAVRTFRWE
ncbi:MAG: ABC transporter permease [Frankiales bacterium]|nr:ABC transporter permease [Frankiales bacterium]